MHLHHLGPLLITANRDFSSAEINRNFGSDKCELHPGCSREHRGGTVLRSQRGKGVLMAIDLSWALCWRAAKTQPRTMSLRHWTHMLSYNPDSGGTWAIIPKKQRSIGLFYQANTWDSHAGE